MTDEQLDTLGELIAQHEKAQRDAAQELEAERMARGLVCCHCGDAFALATGRPTICRACGGTEPTGHPADDPIGAEPAEPLNNWVHVNGRYFANPYDAAFWHKIAAERQRRMVERIRRVLARKLSGEVVTDAKFCDAHEDRLDERYTEIWEQQPARRPLAGD